MTVETPDKAGEARCQGRLIGAIEALRDPLVIYDAEGRLVICNLAYKALVTRTPDKIQPGMTRRAILINAMEEGLLPEPEQGRDAFLDGVLEDDHAGRETEHVERYDGAHYHIARSLTASGDVVVLLSDVTDHVLAARAAKLAEERLHAALQAFPDPMGIYEGDGHLVMCNTAYRTCMSNENVTMEPGQHFREIYANAMDEGLLVEPPEGREALFARIEAENHTGKAAMIQHELPGDRHQRTYGAIAENGDIVILRNDVTEYVRQNRVLEESSRRLQDMNDAITRQSLHDELTGLGNRRFLTEQFARLKDRRQAEGGELSVLNIDLDRFKQINDTMGHAAGDLVLKAVGERLRRLTGPNEWPARNGGDEFVVLIWERAPSDRPRKLAEALVTELPKPVMFRGKTCRFGTSVGLASTPLSDAEQLMSNSDMALYRAKRSGRGRVGIFNTQDLAELRTRQTMADEILAALERSEFEPFYQPQIDAVTGQVVGLEALARWCHPGDGVREPGTFLEIAEDLSVVPSIDRMIFEKAIAQCAGLFGRGPGLPSLSFNVSAGRIRDNDLQDISDLLPAYDGQIVFELLETIFLEEEDTAFLMQLDRLRDMGLSLEVDDFGSGRASIVALQRIGPDRLKIDRRLVSPIARSQKAVKLVRSIVEIANVLEMGVVAEGVETEEHVRILRDLGVERLQGYHFARPLSFEELRAFLRLNEPSRMIF